MAEKSRAGYFRERRKALKQFNVMLRREKVEALEEKLRRQGRTKAAWLEEQVDRELGCPPAGTVKGGEGDADRPWD